MILPDANLLIYALDDTSPHGDAATAWLEETLSGAETVAFAWVALLAVLRLTTRARVFENPFDVDEAVDVIDGWLAQPCATVVHPTDRHASVLRQLLAPIGTGGNLTTDAHLAALSIEHGATVYSADGDFARFSGIRWENPLAS